MWLATRGWEVTASTTRPSAIEKARMIAARSPIGLDRLDYRCGDVTVADYASRNEQGYDLACFFTFICPHHNAPWL